MKTIIHTDIAHAAIGTCSPTAIHNNVLYTPGQTPIIPNTAEMLPSDFSKQIHQVFRNLQAIAIAANTRLQNTLKRNVFLQDLSDFTTLNEIMAEYFEKIYPVKAAIDVAGVPKDSMIAMDAIIAIKQSSQHNE
jgi:reactive intermediate/imine deaminase